MKIMPLPSQCEQALKKSVHLLKICNDNISRPEEFNGGVFFLHAHARPVLKSTESYFITVFKFILLCLNIGSMTAVPFFKVLFDVCKYVLAVFPSQKIDNCSGGSRIFPRRGRQLPKPYYFPNYLLKTAWKWKNLDPRGGVSLAPPPLRSANELRRNSENMIFNPNVRQHILCCPGNRKCFILHNSSEPVVSTHQVWNDYLYCHHKHWLSRK